MTTQTLSQYLVELSHKLEACEGDNAAAFFDTRIQSAAIMLQTLEGKSLTLEQENKELRLQLDTVQHDYQAIKEREGESEDIAELKRRNTNQRVTIEEQLKEIAHLKEVCKERQITIERQEKVIKVAHIPEDPELVARIEQDRAISEAIGYVKSQEDKHEYLIVIRDINHPLNDKNVLVITKDQVLFEISKASSARDEYKSLSNERGDKIKRLREESDSWQTRCAELKMEIERKDIAIESQKNSIRIQMEALQEVKHTHKDLCVGISNMIGAAYTNETAVILDTLQRTMDGLIRDAGPKDPFAYLDKPMPRILINDPHSTNTVDHPAHYNRSPSGVECIDVVEHMTFNIGNATKYLWRAGEKGIDGPIEDYRKSIWYVEREIARLLKEYKSEDMKRSIG